MQCKGEKREWQVHACCSSGDYFLISNGVTAASMRPYSAHALDRAELLEQTEFDALMSELQSAMGSAVNRDTMSVIMQYALWRAVFHKVGDLVVCLDRVDSWYHAYVMQVGMPRSMFAAVQAACGLPRRMRRTMALVHFIAWSTNTQEWVPLSNLYFAAPNSDCCVREEEPLPVVGGLMTITPCLPCARYIVAEVVKIDVGPRASVVTLQIMNQEDRLTRTDQLLMMQCVWETGQLYKCLTNRAGLLGVDCVVRRFPFGSGWVCP